MKRFGVILSAVVVFSIVAFCLGSSGAGQDPDVAGGGPVMFSIDSPRTEAFVEKRGMGDSGLSVASVDPNISLYFFPRDTATTTTVFHVANPTHRKIRIEAWGYDWGGSVVAPLMEGTIAPGMMATICSDDTTNPAAITWNIGSGTSYVEVTLPPDVVVDGYIAWNAANQYDPDVSANTLPLRISAGPIR